MEQKCAYHERYVCFYGVRGTRECKSNGNNTEVSRNHSSEETSVTGVERRAESLKQGSLI